MTNEYFMTIIVGSLFTSASNFLIIFHQKNLVLEKTGHLKFIASVKEKFPNSKNPILTEVIKH